MKCKSLAQSQYEVGGLVITADFNEKRNIKDLNRLMRENKLKEFYQLANNALRVK